MSFSEIREQIFINSLFFFFFFLSSNSWILPTGILFNLQIKLHNLFHPRLGFTLTYIPLETFESWVFKIGKMSSFRGLAQYNWHLFIWYCQTWPNKQDYVLYLELCVYHFIRRKMIYKKSFFCLNIFNVRTQILKAIILLNKQPTLNIFHHRIQHLDVCIKYFYGTN